MVADMVVFDVTDVPYQHTVLPMSCSWGQFLTGWYLTTSAATGRASIRRTSNQ